MRLNQAGVSIIGVLVGTAILGILIAGITTVMNQMVVAQSTLKFQNGVLVVHDEVRALVSLRAACTESFRGLNFTQPTDVYNRTDLKDQTATVAYALNQLYADRALRLNSITIKDYVPATNQATMYMQYVAPMDVAGPRELTRTVALQIWKDGSNNLNDCVALAKASSDSLWKVDALNPSSIYYNAGNVGIGTTSPQQYLDVQMSNEDQGMSLTNITSLQNRYPSFRIKNYLNGHAGFPSYIVQNHRGTMAAQAPVLSGDILGTFEFFGATSATNAIGAASLRVVADGDFSPTSAPGGMHLMTVPIGSILATERVIINSEGDVGIGKNLRVGGGVGAMVTVAGAKLQVDGGAGNTTGVWSNYSDARLKTQFGEIADPLGTIAKLHGLTFEWKDKRRPGRQMGFVAQQVEDVLPQWIREDKQGLKSIEPIGMDALLIEAIKTLHQENQELRARLTDLERQFSALNK